MKNKLPKRSEKGLRRIAALATQPKIRQILATTDFSKESQAGVRYAAALAKEMSATLKLIHVIEPPSRMAGMETLVLGRDDSEILELAKVQLKKLASQENLGGLSVTAGVRTGKAFHEITTAARGRADLIVIATHGYTGASRVLLGSTAERVVRYAPCPVLTIPTRGIAKGAGKMESLKLKRILVPLDFSKISKDALPWAISFAAQFGATITLLNIVEEYPADYLLGSELMNETITPLMKQAEADLNEMGHSLKRSTGIEVSAAVRSGTPFEEICQSANELGIDLIVLTTHGYTGLKHVWLGSTAERVVRHAACPVLIVRGRPNDLLPRRR